MQIFIHRDDQDFGPYTVEEAQEGLAAGNLVPEDHAWYEGSDDWMPLEEIPGVMPTAIAEFEAEPEFEPEPEPEPAPKRSNAGLPAWIPPRRDEDPDQPAPTSFSSRPNYPIGITNLKAPTSDQLTRSLPSVTPGAPKPAAARSKVSTSSAPVDRPMPEVTTYAEDRESAPLPGSGRSMRSIGGRNMLFGGLCFIGGTAVTIYAHESGLGHEHGGAYLAAWGAMGGGLIQFLRGMMQLSKRG